jgi:2'-5' RNA ligase
VTGAGAAYTVNWLLISRWLRLRGSIGALSPGSADIDRTRFLTTFVRPPPPIAERIAEAGASLARVQPEHHVYPAGTIHLTILGLADRPGIEGEIAATVARHRPFEVEIGGLNVSPSTVFAELYPRGSGLRALRRDLRSLDSGEHGPLARRVRRPLAHANLIRFTAPVGPRLLAEVRRLRGIEFGRFVVEELELAETDKVLSGAGTRRLGIFRLGGAPGATGQPE